MSQELLLDWKLPENTATDEFSIAIDDNISFQQNATPQSTLESLTQVSSAQGIQAQAVRTAFKSGEPYKRISMARRYSPPNANSYYSLAGTKTDFTPDSCPGSNLIADGSGIDPSLIIQPFHSSGMPHSYSGLSSLPSTGDLNSRGQMMGEHLVTNQSQLSHFPTTTLGVDDMHQASELQSVFSEVYNPLYGIGPINLQPTTPSIPQLHCAQLLQFSFSPFDTSDTSALGINYDLNMDINQSNQGIHGDMSMPWNYSGYLGNGSTTSSTNPTEDMGTLQNPIQIYENPESTTENQPSSTVVDKNNRTLKPFGPSRPVTLPPARRGGRKGKLSAEELKARREARKKGRCIKCRQTKDRVATVPS